MDRVANVCELPCFGLGKFVMLSRNLDRVGSGLHKFRTFEVEGTQLWDYGANCSVEKFVERLHRVAWHMLLHANDGLLSTIGRISSQRK